MLSYDQPFPSRPSPSSRRAPKLCGRSHADSPSIVGRRYKSAPPRKAHRSTFHASESYIAPRKSGLSLNSCCVGYKLGQPSFVRSLVSFVRSLFQYFPFYLRLLPSSVIAPSSPSSSTRAPRNDLVNFYFGHHSLCPLPSSLRGSSESVAGRTAFAFNFAFPSCHSTQLACKILVYVIPLAWPRQIQAIVTNLSLFVCLHAFVFAKLQRRRSSLWSRGLFLPSFHDFRLKSLFTTAQVFPRAFSIFREHSLSLSRSFPSFRTHH